MKTTLKVANHNNEIAQKNEKKIKKNEKEKNNKFWRPKTDELRRIRIGQSDW